MPAKHRLVFGAAMVSASLLACSAIIGTRDLEYSPDASNGTSSSSTSSTTSSGSTSSSGGDGGDGGTCVADLKKDPRHCGRCGHDCFGGACTDGVCEAYEIGTVAGGPLRQITVGPDHVFVGGIIQYTTEKGGIWRIPKSGGTPEEYVQHRYAEVSAILGDRLYYIVDDEPEGTTAEDHGGLWWCPLSGPAPCTPTLIAAAKDASALVVDKTRLVFGDLNTGKGIMAFDPATGVSVLRADFGSPSNIFADGTFVAYGVSFFSGTPRASVLEPYTDGGFGELYRWENPNAGQGDLVGTAEALYFTAADWGTAASTTQGGRVRRIPRAGAKVQGCDFGASTNKRPYGVYVDATRVYWTTMGEGIAQPWTKGSLQTCDLAGCCTQGTVLWSGDGEPSGMAGDDTAVYWVHHASGSVRRIAKP